jgi:hypothetical protein
MKTERCSSRRREGANEEANLPLAGNYDGLGLGRGSSQLHDYDGGRGGSNGHHRVHDNAELAVIGVGLVRVKVRDLGHGQHRQQNQTKNRHCRQKAGQEARQQARLGSPFAAENCLKSCQSMEPSSSILQKALRGLDAFGLERLPFGNDFEAAANCRLGGSV